MTNAVMLRPLEAWLDTVNVCDAATLLRSLPAGSVNCIVTSPPYYGLRDYNVDGQIGLEDSLQAYIARLVDVFRVARDALRDDGVVWLNLGDTYAGGGRGGDPDDSPFRKQATNRGSLVPRSEIPNGLKSKDLMGVPWRVALALQADGWYLRSDIIWHKPNAMPEGVTDRCSVAHEYVFMLTKSAQYWYDADAIRTPLKPKTYTTFGCAHHPQKGDSFVRAKNWSDSVTERQPKLDAYGNIAGGNKRTVWEITTEPRPFQHYAMFPQALVEPMILAGCPAQVCSVCGAPYERGVDAVPMKIRRSSWGARAGNRTASSGTMLEPAIRKTLGFAPTCDCAAETRPGIVVDPFLGSGTVGLVAQRLGRHYIGSDLNAEYVDLARLRLRYRGDDNRMVTEQDAGVQQLDLFAEAGA